MELHPRMPLHRRRAALVCRGGASGRGARCPCRISGRCKSASSDRAVAASSSQVGLGVCIESRHLCTGQLEIKNIDIFGLILLVAGPRYHSGPLLNEPPQRHLRAALVVGSPDGVGHVPCNQFSVVAFLMMMMVVVVVVVVVVMVVMMKRQTCK